jgi:hypothetical protein
MTNRTQVYQNPHITPPSIPSGDFRFGYKVDEEGHKVISLKSLFQRKVLNEEPANFMGPGYYEVSDKAVVKKRGGLVSY